MPPSPVSSQLYWSFWWIWIIPSTVSQRHPAWWDSESTIKRNIVASAASLVCGQSNLSKLSKWDAAFWIIPSMDGITATPSLVGFPIQNARNSFGGARIKVSDCLGLEALAMQLFCVAMYLHPGWPLKRPFLFQHACLFFPALRSKHEKQQHASLKLGPPAVHNFNSLRKAVSTRWKPYWGTLRIQSAQQYVLASFLNEQPTQMH